MSPQDGSVTKKGENCEVENEFFFSDHALFDKSFHND